MAPAGARPVAKIKHLLVLAGTGEARQLLKILAVQNRYQITASLAGVTSKSLPLGVETRHGGFGGVAGLADWIQINAIDALVDMTHPYAVQMSANAAAAATKLMCPTFAFYRPAWVAGPDDRWQEFVSWQAMADALPAGAKTFLAGGSRDLEMFCQRGDIELLMRGLNLKQYKEKYKNISILESIPNKSIKDEMRLLQDHNITHICCKNSGGAFSDAKLHAARRLGLPVWMLARPKLPEAGPYYQVFDRIEDILVAL